MAISAEERFAAKVNPLFARVLNEREAYLAEVVRLRRQADAQVDADAAYQQGYADAEAALARERAWLDRDREELATRKAELMAREARVFGAEFAAKGEEKKATPTAEKNDSTPVRKPASEEDNDPFA